jgi:large subunit ribosomal protein L21
MKKFAVVKTGGKQYVVSEEQELIVDQLPQNEGQNLELETLARFDENGVSVDLGAPILKESTKAKVIIHLKGDKIRVAKFKSKVRYRKVKGFRSRLSKIKILKI